MSRAAGTLSSTAATVDGAAVTLQAAALLLEYPGPGSDADLDLITDALAESPHAPGHAALARFVRWWSGLAPSEREQRYVASFDLGEPVSLYLTERRSGGRRSCAPDRRGEELLALRRAYAGYGVDVSRDELPDYLPLLLEVAAHVPAARALLAEHRAAVDRLAAALDERGDPFADVAAAVVAAADAPAPREATP